MVFRQGIGPSTALIEVSAVRRRGGSRKVSAQSRAGLTSVGDGPRTISQVANLHKRGALVVHVALCGRRLRTKPEGRPSKLSQLSPKVCLCSRWAKH